MPYYIKRKKKEPSEKKSRKSPTLSTLVDRLDTVFSKYIRLRDAMPSGMFRCISCGQIKPISQADCGHFHSRIHMSTRFDEDNCHAECRFCNRFSADHIIGYRENLIKKIGGQRFALLEVKAHQSHKYAHFEIEQLIKYYRARVEMLQREKGIRL
ncbi:MAG: recombination protein NinG [Prevotella sp.]|nr:recombination protein NinG [Prevotella sp.]